MFSLAAAQALSISVDVPGSLASGGDTVLAPPVAITDVEWDNEWEDGKGYMVRVVRLSMESTDGGTHDVDVYVSLTQGGNLLHELEQHLVVNEPPGSAYEFNFNGADVPAADVDDLHVMICEQLAVHPSHVCVELP